MKRQKWSSEEDECLRRVVGEVGEGDWEEVVRVMGRSGFRKTRKQILDRWNLQLRPGVNKLSMTLDEKSALFVAQRESKNCWKLLSSRENFPTRSCVWLKTQFFLVVRRAIRKAKKFLGHFSEIQKVTLIKPGAILKFMDELIELGGEDPASPALPWLKSGFEGRELVVFFSMTPSYLIEPLKSARLVSAVKTALLRLENINSLHCKLKALRLNARSSLFGLQTPSARLEGEAVELTELIESRLFFLEKRSLSFKNRTVISGITAELRADPVEDRPTRTSQMSSVLAELNQELGDLLGPEPRELTNVSLGDDTVHPKSLIFNFSRQLSIFTAFFTGQAPAESLELQTVKKTLAYYDSPSAYMSALLPEGDLEFD